MQSMDIDLQPPAVSPAAAKSAMLTQIKGMAGERQGRSMTRF